MKHEIIGDVQRLVGCNMKVVASSGRAYFSHSRIGNSYTVTKAERPTHSSRKIFLFTETGLCFNEEEFGIILDDVFLKKFKEEKIVVHCETKKDANKFCNWMYGNGMAWISGAHYLNNPYYKTYDTNTCYTGEGTYCSKEFYEYENYTIINFKDTTIVETNVSVKTKSPIITNLEYNYRVTKPFTLKDIIDYHPCATEFAALINDMKEKNYNLDIAFDIPDIYKLPTLHKNIKWLKENGFVEKVKEFEPFDLTLRIETEDQLKSLWCRLNINDEKYERLCQQMRHYVEYHETDTWKDVDNEMWRVEE